MKLNKKRYLVYSSTILIFGWLYVFAIDFLNYSNFMGQFKDGVFILIPRSGKYDTILFKLIGIGFGLFSLYFAFINKTINQKILRILLISISILLILIVIIVFPNFIL